MRRQLLPALVVTVVLTVLLGIVYPLVVTGVNQLFFSGAANGSLVKQNGQVVGSALIGQPFTDPGYFHPRPSATSDASDSTKSVPYNAANSAGSNLGPSNPVLVSSDPKAATKSCSDKSLGTDEPCIGNIDQAAIDYRADNRLPATFPVPVDAVTSSGSGLDADISLANARLQAPRVALARRMTVAAVDALIDEHVDKASLSFLGESGVNVLQLNLALDASR